MRFTYKSPSSASPVFTSQYLLSHPGDMARKQGDGIIDQRCRLTGKLDLGAGRLAVVSEHTKDSCLALRKRHRRKTLKGCQTYRSSAVGIPSGCCVAVVRVDTTCRLCAEWYPIAETGTPPKSARKHSTFLTRRTQEQRVPYPDGSRWHSFLIPALDNNAAVGDWSSGNSHMGNWECLPAANAR